MKNFFLLILYLNLCSFKSSLGSLQLGNESKDCGDENEDEDEEDDDGEELPGEEGVQCSSGQSLIRVDGVDADH